MSAPINRPALLSRSPALAGALRRGVVATLATFGLGVVLNGTPLSSSGGPSLTALLGISDAWAARFGGGGARFSGGGFSGGGARFSGGGFQGGGSMRYSSGVGQRSVSQRSFNSSGQRYSRTPSSVRPSSRPSYQTGRRPATGGVSQRDFAGAGTLDRTRPAQQPARARTMDGATTRRDLGTAAAGGALGGALGEGARGARDDRQAALGERQTQRTERQGERQGTREERAGERTERAGDRQEARTERREDWQEFRSQNREDRQDWLEDNWDDIEDIYDDHDYWLDDCDGCLWGLTGLAIGAAIASIPNYYDSVYVGGVGYYYYGGVYYAPAATGYVVVDAPVGAVVAAPPPECYVVSVEAMPYCYYHGTFYLFDDSGNYMVVAAPAGAVVPYLPTGAATERTSAGATYYRYSSVVYQPVYDGSELAYKVVYL